MPLPKIPDLPETSLSKSQARRIILHAQGLLKNPVFAHRKSKTLDIIRHLGYVQIDTISVINRAHHHTLWSRMNTYRMNDLWELMGQDKSIFEYWSHAAAFLPMEDFRFSLVRKQELKSGDRAWWYERDPKLMKYVMDRIRAEGPLQARDFEHATQKGGVWYEWKPAKIALGQLFMEGDLMIAARKGFQKVFDLTERVVPAHIDTSSPTEKEMGHHLIDRALATQGIMAEREMYYLRKNRKHMVREALIEKVNSGQLKKIKVKGLDETYWIHTDLLERSPKRMGKKRLFILSPFDNFIIQRNRLEQFFDFSYLIECYVPAAKRKFGYFTLPILWGDQLIGRLDAKAERKQKHFVVKHIWLEQATPPVEEWLTAMAENLISFMHFHQCERISIEQTQPGFLKEKLIQEISELQ
ncbi:MAG: crosslink repair DNA glycosylase YcaQ family protein [Bacteroidota bacterium]